MALMFLNGEGMAGGSAHHHIAGSEFLGGRRTAPIYRLLAFDREFPGLVTGPLRGASITGELYEVPMNKLVNLLDTEPSELELSMVQLNDGELSFGMIVRRDLKSSRSTEDITDIGSWRGFLAGQPRLH